MQVFWLQILGEKFKKNLNIWNFQNMFVSLHHR